MATYIILGHFTQKGIGAAKNSIKRSEDFSKLVESLGGKVEDARWLLGRYDVFLKVSAPSDEIMALILLKSGTHADVQTECFRAFDAVEMKPIFENL